MMTTLGGEKTYRFDQMSSEEAMRELDRLTNENDLLKKKIDSLSEELRMASEFLTANIDLNSGLDELVKEQKKLIDDYDDWMKDFLRLSVIRFLNMFRGWFIYGDDGKVYSNIPENESKGKLPLCTRIRRLFMRQKPETTDQTD